MALKRHSKKKKERNLSVLKDCASYIQFASCFFLLDVDVSKCVQYCLISYIYLFFVFSMFNAVNKDRICGMYWWKVLPNLNEECGRSRYVKLNNT